MFVLTLDSEQAELVEIAAEMMHAAMDARARRIDPDEWISKTAKMSRAKMDSVIAQYRLGPLMRWHEISLARRGDFLKLCKALSDAQTEEEQSVVYSGVLGMVLYRDADRELPWHNAPDETQDL